MAIDSLNQRLDQMSPDSQQAQDQSSQQMVLPNIEPNTPDAPPQSDDGANSVFPVDNSQFQEYEPEAGLFTQLVKKSLKNAPLNKERKILKDNVDSGKIGPYSVIKEDAPVAKILSEVDTTVASGKPSPTQIQKDAGVNQTIFNLDMIKDADGVRQFIEAIAKEYGADKLPKMSYKEVAEKAALEGYDERFIARILDPNVQTTASPEDAYKMMLAITDAGKRAFDLAQEVKLAAKNGTLNPDLVTKFHQAIALEGVLAKAAKGRQADIARTLGIFSQARTSSVNRGAQLDEILKEAGGIQNSFELANSYTALDGRSDRLALSEKTISGTVKDIWFSTYINGLLSSFPTHAKNIAGNSFFGVWQIPERIVASGIGKGRNFIFRGGEEAIKVNEIYAQAVGMLQGIREGGSIAWTAFKKNEPTDALSKIENVRNGRDTFDVSFGDSTTAKALNGAMKYWGTFVTLPSRFLMAEDEFFKAVGYSMEKNALVTREANKEYSNLIKNGIDENTAATQAAALHEKLLIEPTAEIEEAAKSMSSTVTFTRELEPNLQAIEKFISNATIKDFPVLKLFFPFVKTPTNIAMEAMSRTPILNLFSPRFKADWDAGGIRRDMAISRVTLGGLMIYGAGSYALEGKLTGYGPMRSEDKAALEATGWQQFSFVLNKSDVDPEMLAKYKKITSVKEGPDKYYVSYAGIEPFSSLLSIASTAGEYAMLEGSGSDMEKIFTGGAVGLYQYTGDQPMLQGFGEIMKVLSAKSKDVPTFLYNVMSQVSKQGTSFVVGGSPAGAYSSFIASVERVMHPEKSLVKEAVSPDDVGLLSGGEKGFWEALGTYCSRNPLCSDRLPVQKDPITGNEKRISSENWAEKYSPFKTSDGKFSPAHAVLVEYGVPMPQVPKKIDGVELTDQQINQWIDIATTRFKIEENIVRMGKDEGFKRLAARDLGAAQTMLGAVISEAYNGTQDRYGAKHLLINDPANRDLHDAIESVKEKQREFGKYKR
jgi:hypothetical protein